MDKIDELIAGIYDRMTPQEKAKLEDAIKSHVPGADYVPEYVLEGAWLENGMHVLRRVKNPDYKG